MSDTPKDGGPAFPTQDNASDCPEASGYFFESGMSLRQYFAGRAMQGLLSNSSIDQLTPAEIASDATLFADALIAELEARK